MPDIRPSDIPPIFLPDIYIFSYRSGSDIFFGSRSDIFYNIDSDPSKPPRLASQGPQIWVCRFKNIRRSVLEPENLPDFQTFTQTLICYPAGPLVATQDPRRARPRGRAHLPGHLRQLLLLLRRQGRKTHSASQKLTGRSSTNGRISKLVYTYYSLSQ